MPRRAQPGRNGKAGCATYWDRGLGPRKTRTIISQRHLLCPAKGVGIRLWRKDPASYIREELEVLAGLAPRRPAGRERGIGWLYQIRSDGRPLPAYHQVFWIVEGGRKSILRRGCSSPVAADEEATVSSPNMIMMEKSHGAAAGMVEAEAGRGDGPSSFLSRCEDTGCHSTRSHKTYLHQRDLRTLPQYHLPVRIQAAP